MIFPPFKRFTPFKTPNWAVGTGWEVVIRNTLLETAGTDQADGLSYFDHGTFGV
jgi:hypothetical protein